ncbi:MAG: nitroreductase family protein [Betaproteobacteria bacterium]|nr:nitroreductase family protein [Betaproteobacteria bacterium]MDH5220403.1 nitroreductase family protein [Betaproteobacteria bacterium]MDH5352076.1 nitroreductase family protein [Betaproteobacteria bacterium]
MPAENPSSRAAAAAAQRFGAALRAPALAQLDALAALNERSVCRQYRPDPVPEDVVRLLCATALSAPTKSDLQQASIVRVADPAKKAAICSLLPGSPWLAGAPELFVFCADGWRLRRLFARKGVAFPNEHLDAFFNASVDAAIALSAFVSAAELAGLGTCPISQVRDHVERIDALLSLPDWVVPVAGLALGYPEAKEPLSARLSLSATVHTDKYDVDAVERELDAYDARRGKDWSGDKVKQYSRVLRADFGAYVARKRFKLT